MGYQAQISLNMIRFELQKKLTEQFSHKQGLNIESYIINNELHREMKDSMEKQAKIQQEFWKEFLLNNPNMMNLMKISLEVESQKMIVKELFHKLLKIRPVSFLSPLIVYGMYSSLINNDSIEGEKYIEQSQEEAKRMRRFLTLSPEIYLIKNFLFALNRKKKFPILPFLNKIFSETKISKYTCEYSLH